jgi:ankyrin repeat protein
VRRVPIARAVGASRASRRAFCVAVLGVALLPRRARAQELLEDLVIAVRNDRAGEVRALLARGLDANSVDAGGDSLLLIAAREGNVATVDVLIAARAKVDAVNAHNDTPMLVAALKGHLAIMQRLQKAGAAIDTPGWTPLIYAATGGLEDVVRWLLAQNVKVDEASPNGITALMMATREHHVDVADLLLERGADASRRNAAGLSALDYATQGGEDELAARLRARMARKR